MSLLGRCVIPNGERTDSMYTVVQISDIRGLRQAVLSLGAITPAFSGQAVSGQPCRVAFRLICHPEGLS